MTAAVTDCDSDDMIAHAILASPSHAVGVGVGVGVGTLAFSHHMDIKHMTSPSRSYACE